MTSFFFFFQAEDGIRDAQESRGLGDVYKRQTVIGIAISMSSNFILNKIWTFEDRNFEAKKTLAQYGKFVGFSSLGCLLYTSDAADEEDSVDLGGRRIIKKKKKKNKNKQRLNQSKKKESTSKHNKPIQSGAETLSS